MPGSAKSAAGRILHNSFWYGLETVIETIIFLGTSIAVARFYGPDMLGYFSYINFFITVVTRTSGSGLASATRKYMSEFLALDRPGTARAVYYLASRYQLVGACLISGVSLVCILLFGDPGYRVMSCILLLSLVPGVMSWVPAQANQAFEDVSHNTISAFGYIFSYALVIVLTLVFGWGLIGIASAQLIGRSVEVLMRTIPLNQRLRRLPLDELDDAVKLRIRDFCVQAVGIQLIASVVWDRSEMFFLKHFCALNQLAFYSVSFTFAGNLLLLPRTFSSATGITLMVESLRDPGRVDSIVKNSCRYLLLVIFPVNLGAAAIAGHALAFAYGSKYTGAIPVVVVASLLALPRGFQEIAEVLLRAADRQRRILLWYGITGVLNVALDLYLIPRHGAIGAAWGNGLAQAFGIAALWWQARRSFRFGFPVWTAVRLSIAALVMASLAYSIVRHVPGLAGLVAAVLAAVVSYIVLVKLLRGLQSSDRERLAPLGARLPAPLRRMYRAVVDFATPGPAKARAAV